MKNWTVRTRIILGFGIIILITLAFGVFAYTRLVAIERLSSRVAQECLPAVTMTGQIDALVREVYALTLKHTLVDDQQSADKIQEQLLEVLGKINQIEEAYTNKIASAMSDPLLEAIRSARKPYGAASTEIVLTDRTNIKQRIAMVQTNLDPAYQTYLATVKAEVESQSRNGEEAGKGVTVAVAAISVMDVLT